LPILLLKWRTTGKRVSWNSLRAMMCRLKQFTPLLTRICSSQKVSQMGEMLYKEMQKEWLRTCEAVTAMIAVSSWLS
jgi:hypothetical protein